MHLCEPCRAKRDAGDDMAVQDTRHGCADCRRRIRNPSFRLCARCAKRSSLCQHCSGSTLSKERRDAEEDFQRLLDLFITSRKCFGLKRTLELFEEHREKLGSADVTRALAIGADAIENDPDRKRRHIWTRVFGMLRIGTPRPVCDKCAAGRFERYCRAQECGHWTVSMAARWCFPCAVADGRCATCSTPMT